MWGSSRPGCSCRRRPGTAPELQGSRAHLETHLHGAIEEVDRGTVVAVAGKRRGAVRRVVPNSTDDVVLAQASGAFQMMTSVPLTQPAFTGCISMPPDTSVSELSAIHCAASLWSTT